MSTLADGDNPHSDGREGGSIKKQEKRTVLRHRSRSQRRAMPVAFYGGFPEKWKFPKPFREISAGAGFEGQVPDCGAVQRKSARAATGFGVIQPVPTGFWRIHDGKYSE